MCNDRPKTSMEDPGALLGQHLGGGVVLAMEKLGLENSGRRGVRQGRERDEE